METQTQVTCSPRTPRPTFAEQKHILRLPPADQGNRYAFYRHISVPGFYVRVRQPDATGFIERRFQVRVVTTGADGRSDDRWEDLGPAQARPWEMSEGGSEPVLTLEAALGKAVACRAAGARPQFRVPTLQGAFDTMLKRRLVDQLINDVTVESHRSRFARLLSSYGNRRLDTLDLNFWQALYREMALPRYDDMTDEQKRDEGMELAQIQLRLKRQGLDWNSRRRGTSQAYGAMQIASAIYTDACFTLKRSHGYTLDHPLRDLRAFLAFRKPRERTSTVEHVNLDKVWAILREDESAARDAWLIYLFCGYRLQAALTLRWDQIHFDRKTVEIPPPFDKSGKPRLPGWKKIPGHELPLPTWVVENVLLPRYIAADGECPWVFPAARGGRENKRGLDKKAPHMQSVRRMNERLSKALGYDVTAHDARRTFGTLVDIVTPTADIRQRMLTHNLAAKADGAKIASLYNVTHRERVRPHFERLSELLQELMGIRPMSADNRKFLAQHGLQGDGFKLGGDPDAAEETE